MVETMCNKYIGMAKMKEDGTLVLDLRATGPSIVGNGQVIYKVGDKNYNDVIQHIGKISPGEEKPVLPWP